MHQSGDPPLSESLPVNRRGALGLMAGAVAAVSTGGRANLWPSAPRATTGTLKQSVCRWCYDKIPLDDLCAAAKTIGLRSVELLDPPEWATTSRHGLVCAMGNGPGPIAVGWNRPDHHDHLVAESERLLPLAAQAGVPNLVVFSGNRAGLSDADGIASCIAGLKRVAPLAERAGVTLCLELLNSKVDHADYQCDHTAWGVEVVKGVASSRVKLLYDIYHMQIMEGDVIHTIRDNIAHIAHFHTGGVPGRAEIDDGQELNYHRIASAIVATGFDGYLAQEFIPARDPLTSLRQAVEICDA
ncbi:MAG: TIM barrel protein [Gemmatimonadota bacterium]